MIGWDDVWQYVTVFCTLLAAGFGLPIPEEIPVVTGGILVGREWNNPDTGIHWWIMLPLCMFGVVLGDVVLYTIGRRYGYHLLNSSWVQRKILPPHKQATIEENFHKYGVYILMFARLTPGIRSPVFIMAGILKMPLRKFMLADGIYAIPGVSLFFWLGFWFADAVIDIINKVNDHKPLIILMVLAAGTGYFLRTYIRRPISTGDPTSVPFVGKVAETLLIHPEEKPVVSASTTETKELPAVEDKPSPRYASPTELSSAITDTKENPILDKTEPSPNGRAEPKKPVDPSSDTSESEPLDPDKPK